MVRACAPGQLREIFARGHYFEAQSRERLIAAGFRFSPPEGLAFSAVNGLLRGHADGIIIAGPNLPGEDLNFPFMWEHKCINAKTGAHSNATDKKKPSRNTPLRFRSIKPISTSPTPRSSLR